MGTHVPRVDGTENRGRYSFRNAPDVLGLQHLWGLCERSVTRN